MWYNNLRELTKEYDKKLELLLEEIAGIQNVKVRNVVVKYVKKVISMNIEFSEDLDKLFEEDKKRRRDKRHGHN